MIDSHGNLEANKSDFQLIARQHMGQTLRYLSIALEGFHSLTWLNTHMAKKMCNVCAQATVLRVGNTINDEEFLEQCCVLAVANIQKVKAAQRLSNKLPAFLDELEAIYRAMLGENQ